MRNALKPTLLLFAVSFLLAGGRASSADYGEHRLISDVQYTLSLWDEFFGNGETAQAGTPRRGEPEKTRGNGSHPPLAFYEIGTSRGFFLNDPRPFFPLFSRAANRTGVPETVLAAVAACESSFLPDAVSHAGAKGLMQIMPMNFEPLGIEDPFNPEESVMGGARFLRKLYLQTGSWRGALASYHCGLGCWKRRDIPRTTQKYVACALRQFGFFRDHGPW